MDLKRSDIDCFLLLRYFIGIQKCLGLYSEKGQYSSEEIEHLDELYKSLRDNYHWSSAVKVNMPLHNMQSPWMS